MKKLLLALAFAAFASPANARVPPRMPEPMQTAPVERAIANVGADASLSEAQRERLLGRLHLIAYAQGQEEMTQYSNGEWQPPGQHPCGDRGYAERRFGGRTCPYGYDGLPIARELPTRRQPPASLRSNHLSAAREHYERSIAIDDTNLRAHLGLAYVLDESKESKIAHASTCAALSLCPMRTSRRVIIKNTRIGKRTPFSVRPLSTWAFWRSRRKTKAPWRVCASVCGLLRPTLTLRRSWCL